MIKNYLIRRIKQLSWNLGYELKNKTLTPIHTISNDPRELAYRKDLPLTIINLPIHLGIGLRVFPLSKQSMHPYIIALKHNKSIKDAEKFALDVFKKYNELINIQSPNDYLGLNKEERIFEENKHPLEYAYPWSRLLPTQEKLKFLKIYSKENKQLGLDSDEVFDLGGVSVEKLKIEAKRITALTNSIKKEGYKPSIKDPIGCFVLINGEKWKWYVRGGQHRAAILTFLKYEKIPVFVKRIIRREEVGIWPNVQSGVYTEEEALLIFDKLFESTLPYYLKDWKKYVEETFRDR